MEKIDFSIAADRRGTDSVKWDKNAIESISSNPDALPFWVADMDFLPEEHIRETARGIAENGIFGYPKEHSDLNSLISRWLHEKHGWDVVPVDIVFTMGLLHGIALAIDLFTSKGDRILIPMPAYRPFRTICEDSERTAEEMPLHYENGMFSLDYDEFRQHAEKCSMILFCSPHNPSGLVFSRKDLEYVLRTAKELGIPVISDEIHADLVHPTAEHIPLGKANDGINADCITFMATSKTFNIAGEHSAFAVFSDPEKKAAFMRKQKALCLTAPGLTAGALTETVYRYGLDYNARLCRYLEENADFIREFLKENCPEIRITNGDASFVVFLDCTEIFDKAKKKTEEAPERYAGGDGGGILSRFFGAEAGIAMNDGTWFGDEYRGFVRFNYGTSRDMVRIALERISEAVKALR